MAFHVVKEISITSNVDPTFGEPSANAPRAVVQIFGGPAIDHYEDLMNQWVQNFLAMPKSLLMYSDDIMGLGHFRRNSIIAARFVRDNSGSSVWMLTGLPKGCYFELPEGDGDT